ncbi:MAG: tetratricopeptide repeat protein [Syntrophales bacterium]|nr:tetratricopeptide repeat protein [Syntrophales bacterium]
MVRKLMLVAQTCFFLFVFSFSAYAQISTELEKGIREYQADNYEEAIEILSSLRQKEPLNAMTAFFLGMAYKQVGDYPKAIRHLEDASTLKPPVREAPIELIDCLVQMKKYPEAKKWVAEAERSGIYPAKVFFLKGILLAEEGKTEEAVASFERSKSLDKSYAQAADLQIGLVYMGARKFDKARERLQAVITQDPVSDLAIFARRYRDMVEQRSFLERPLRFTISLLGQYDTNMLQEPYAWPGLGDTGEEKSYAMTNTVRVDFVPRLSGPWLFNATYALVSNVHQKNATSHDLLANTFSINPGYNFGRLALNIAATYTHVLRRNPSYERYVENLDVGPLLRVVVTENQLVELYGGYLKKNYFTTPLAPAEDQSSQGFGSYISYAFFFKNGALVNVRYRYTEENTKGENWENTAHAITLNSIIPLWKTLRAQLGGEVTIQNYDNVHTFFGEKRRDRLYVGIAGLVYDINNYMSLTAQYQYTRGYSNIFLYDYHRHLWSAGVEFRF